MRIIFCVTIEMFSGDGEILQTWEYGKCEITNYDVYLEDGLLNYKFHDKWQSEIRDIEDESEKEKRDKDYK